MRNAEKMLAILDAIRTAPNGEAIIAPGRFGLSKEQRPQARDRSHEGEERVGRDESQSAEARGLSIRNVEQGVQ